MYASMNILRWHKTLGRFKINPRFGKVTEVCSRIRETLLTDIRPKFSCPHDSETVLEGDESRCQDSSLDDALRVNEAPALDPEWATADCKKLEALQRASHVEPIYISDPESVATTNAMSICRRHPSKVNIRRWVKYATMSGTGHTHHWRACWELGENWENPLMGWRSSSDPYVSMSPLTFPDEASAVSFCKKNEYDWYVQRDPPPTRKPIVRRYQDNFLWNRRCRVSTR